MVRRLGKGILELMGEDSISDSKESHLEYVATNLVYPGVLQPRKEFDEKSIQELATSIANNGVIQPIIVKRSTAGRYEIIAGERRWRASILANIQVIPVIIKEIGDKECLEISIIENIHRCDLNVIEEAEAYKKLIEMFGYTQASLASTLGKSRSHITNIIRLLSLPCSVKAMVIDGSLSFGHARCLLNIVNQEAIAQKVVSLGLSVRQTEELIRKIGKTDTKIVAPILSDIEQYLTHKFGFRVKVGKDHKKMTISFSGKKQYERFIEMLRGL